MPDEFVLKSHLKQEARGERALLQCKTAGLHAQAERMHPARAKIDRNDMAQRLQLGGFDSPTATEP